MFTDKKRIKGLVTFSVFDKDGNIKTFKKSLLRKILGLRARPMKFCHHNTITKTGDAMLADLMVLNPVFNKVDENGCMIVGNGWTGTSVKENTTVNNVVSDYKKLCEGFPKKEADYGSDGDNIVLYRAIFDCGDLNCDGINEAALLNGNDENAMCLAYAQITPAINVTESDSLQIDWAISICGS